MSLGGAGGVDGRAATSPRWMEMSPLVVEIRTEGPPALTEPVTVLCEPLDSVASERSVSMSPSLVSAWTEKPACSGTVTFTEPLRSSRLIAPSCLLEEVAAVRSIEIW